ncbi:MAG: NADP-dependent oxidoreductase, partial [Betaproteobacteria bacterium]|nr:NADP-dependent oxidoreductase [Betaproteobacteria bacterium]
MSASSTNRQIHLMRRPRGEPVADDFALVHSVVPVPGRGELLVRNRYISLDPAMRGWMREQRSYVEPVALGGVMRAGAAAEVIESRHPDFNPGDFVTGLFGVQEIAVTGVQGVTRVDPHRAPLTHWLNALGMPGMTAYFGLLDVGQPQAGQTVVVSAAAGAVGPTVGQIARIKGCRAVGIAGGADKCRMVVEEYGFDACVDYKAADFRAQLKAACPNGIDVYFDNVGGEVLDLVITQLASKARVVLCGAISQYNRTGAAAGPANYLALILYRARMEGMVVFDYAARFSEGVADIATWMAEGKLKSKEQVIDGIENYCDAL